MTKSQYKELIHQAVILLAMLKESESKPEEDFYMNKAIDIIERIERAEKVLDEFYKRIQNLLGRVDIYQGA